MSLEQQNIAAFPQENHVPVERRGMTLLDYHAAHAPANPPEWWQPNMRVQPQNMLIARLHFTEEKRQWIDQYLDDDGEWHDKGPDFPADIPDSFKEEVKEYIDRYNKNWEDIQQWKKEEQYERLVQWPYFYAVQMLMRRESYLNYIKHITLPTITNG